MGELNEAHDSLSEHWLEREIAIYVGELNEAHDSLSAPVADAAVYGAALPPGEVRFPGRWVFH